MHAGRSEWTDGADVVKLVVAIAAGSLDSFSGGFLRAGVDDPQSLQAADVAGLPPRPRSLGLLPWGPDDPLA